MGRDGEALVVVVCVDGSRHKTSACRDGATVYRSGKEALYAISYVSPHKLDSRERYQRRS
jgi:hypothetical protein